MTKLLWHEPSNMLAVYDSSDAVAMLTILGEEWEDEIRSSVPCYPLSQLELIGWRDLGELE
jgi:hypothetical protein